MSKTKFFVLFFIFLLLIPLSFAADDQYKPYLHKAVVPEHPQVKLYGKYSTNLFPGAGTYTYEIEVPKGTNNLQPAISLSYNSQAVKQRPSILGAGWTLPQNYILRDVNFTPANTTDDKFKLILNGVSYDLIYDNVDDFFHTEIETFAKIQNITNNSNSYNQYWLLTLKGGTKLRFGYNSDSELTSNVGYDYALKWSLDQIEDTHENKIFYSYLEDPSPEDNGTSYIQEILYNNDEKRKIEFGYENSNRPDRRKVYEQGNVLEESRRLSDVNVYFNDTLIRRYNFSYENLNDEDSLSSLSKIKYFGSDNFSLLHQVTFDFYQSTLIYSNSTTYNVTALFSDSSGVDQGVRLIDINNDGYIDIIQGKQSGSVKKIWINNKTNWSQTSDFTFPDDPSNHIYFIDTSNYDKGLRIADLNNDGFPDLIKGLGGVQKAWLNNGSGWKEESLVWPPPIDFVSTPNEQGVRLVDFNGDGRVDLLQSKEDASVKKAYLNTGSGWKDVSSLWVAPAFFVKSDWNDYGLRAVDVNGDGLVDLLQGYNFGTETKKAWLNNGSGWVSSAAWEPPVVFTSSSKADEGARLVDLNGDGLTDILVDFANTTTTERSAWINNGSGWTQSTAWQSPEPFTKDGKNKGRRIGDVNGDGFADILVGYNDGSDIKRVVIRNSTIPYLLKNITNEFGGLTDISYSQSTKYNNTGEDGISDIGFNVWVVEEVLQDNSLSSDFNVLGSTSYLYFGGLYDYNDSEFRGFNIVNETLADNSTIKHYFHQDDTLKGKEYRTITYASNGNIFSKTENNYNFTLTNNSIFINKLKSSSSYLYDGNSLNPKITNVSYKYDAYSNVISKTSFGDISISGDEKYENYTFVYNNTLWILDKVSKYQLFDSSYNKLRETKYFYDNKLVGLLKGDLTKQEEWLNDETGNPVTYYNYDSYGNPYRQTDALGRTIIYYYGNKDNTNTYPDRRVNELGHAVDYEYDVGTGNLLSQTKNGITTYSKYDTFGRIEKEIQPYDSSDLPTKKYTYDFDGIAPEIIKVSQKTTSNNTIDIYYYYDGFANLVQIKTPAEDGQQVVKNIFYDGLFRVKEEQNPYFDAFSSTISNVSNNTNTTKYNYDSLSRITSVINPDGTKKNTTYDKNVIKDYDENNNLHTYYLDAYDRITAVEEHNTDFYIKDNETYNTTYSYNGADELVSIRDNEGNNFNFTYNSLGQKIQLDDPDLGTWKYGYDFAGNLISQVGGGGNLVTGDNFYREYNALNQMISVKEGNDASGRLLEEYSYDSNGDRIKINRYSYSGGTNETIYTPYKEWMRVVNSSGSFDFYYIYQGDNLVARKNADGTTYYYHPDHLGSTSLITDENGNVVEEELYSPFGESLDSNDAEENKLYTGQFKDSIENQYYYGTRYYNPSWGRFIQCDKIKPDAFAPQALNCYAYSLNNPLTYYDWNGNVAVLFQGGFDRNVNANNGMYQIYQQLDSDVRSASQVFANQDPIAWNYGVTTSEARDFVVSSLEADPNQPVVIIGHSIGGGHALELQQLLGDEGIAVDLVITIDPYSHYPNHRELFLSPTSKKSINLNFYQRDEGFNGFILEGANNALITGTTHTTIDSNRLVQNAILNLVNYIHNQYWNRFSSGGGKPIVKDGVTNLGSGGRSGSFSCYASSCSVFEGTKKQRDAARK